MKVSGLVLFATFFASVAHALPNYGGYGAEVTTTTTTCNGEVEGANATPADVGYGATSTPSVEGENVTTTDVGYGATSTPAVQGEESGYSTPCESPTATPEVQGEASGTTPCETATTTPAVVEGEASGTIPCDDSTPTPTVQGEDEDCDEYEDEETTPGVDGASTPTSTVEAAAAYLQSSASRTSSHMLAFLVAGAALAASVAAF
ncbi:hypothetical protein BJ742DRAFT_815849 [Cladochytrium replicatum]|nr:hypothetical protein BJ742DRAFT_815849 [Cladochytrium replicatum]